MAQRRRRPPPAPQRGGEDIASVRRDLQQCQRMLATKATLTERFEAGTEDRKTTIKVREELQRLQLGNSILDDVECRDGICLAHVTNRAADDET